MNHYLLLSEALHSRIVYDGKGSGSSDMRTKLRGDEIKGMEIILESRLHNFTYTYTYINS